MQMRIALAFGRIDVDAFLDGISYDQYEEWCSFFALEPQGWQAIDLQTARLAYSTFQSQTKRKLKEKDFGFQIGTNQHDPATERARWEAFSVRQSIHAELNKLDGKEG